MHDENRPYSLIAERRVICSMVMNADCIDSVLVTLADEDFYDKNHVAICAAIRGLYGQRRVVDEVTVGEVLGVDSGAYMALLEAIENYGDMKDPSDHCEIIKNKALLRRLMKFASVLYDTASNSQANADEVLSQSQADLFDLSVSEDRSYKSVGDLLPQVMREIEDVQSGKIVSVKTGFDKLDALTSGFHAGDLIIGAGRPSMGKTAIAVSIMKNACAHGPVAIFSMEMDRSQIMQRILCAEAKVDLHLMRMGKLLKADFAKLGAMCGVLAEKPILINDTPGLSPIDILSECRRMRRGMGTDLALIVVDYLQLMSSKNKKCANRQEEISYFSRALKGIAKEFRTPVLALSQLSRAVEQRPDKRPVLSDLRESGAIEQDADIVMFVYRDEYYHPIGGDAPTEKPNVVEAIIRKQRNGPIGAVDLSFVKFCALVEDMAGEDDEKWWD